MPGAILLIALSVVAAFGTGFLGTFVFDDHSAIEQNPTIKELSWRIFSPPAGGATVEGRPLLNASFALNHAISGRAIWSYHALNLLIQIAAALAAFGMLSRLLAAAGVRGARESALVIALLWAVHPLQTESVTYISQRTESLMGLFYLLTIYLFIRGATAHGGANRWLVGSVVACALGMAAKEVMVSAPLLVLLVDRTLFATSFRDAVQRRRWYYIALAATWTVLIASIAGHTTRGGTIGTTAGITWWQYAFCQARAIVHYLRLSILPSPLIFDYGDDFVTFGQIWMHGVADVALLGLTFLGLWRRSAWALLGAWFFFILGPTTSVVGGTRQMLAEHRMYLPLLSIITPSVLGLYCLAGRRTARVGAVAAALALSAVAAHRNLAYSSELTLYTDTYTKRPNNAYTSYDLASVLPTPARQAEAVALYQKAIRLTPDFAEPHFNLGNILSHIPGKEAAAAAEYEATLRINPQFYDAHLNLAELLSRVPGEQPRALAHFQTALQLRPDSFVANYDCANFLAAWPGHDEEAIERYRRAVAIRPDSSDCHNNLGVLLARFPGRQTDALEQYETALRLNPADAEAHNNLGQLLTQSPGRDADARLQFEAALRLKPDYAAAHVNLANILAREPGHEDEVREHLNAAVRLQPDAVAWRIARANHLAAIPAQRPRAAEDYAAALRLNPKSVEAHNGLGVLWARIPGHDAQAIAEFQTALQIEPDFADAHYNLGLVLKRTPDRRSEAAEQFKEALRLRPDYAAARAQLQTVQPTTASPRE